MKFRHWADFARTKLDQVPRPVAQGVKDALLLAQCRVLGRLAQPACNLQEHSPVPPSLSSSCSAEFFEPILEATIEKSEEPESALPDGPTLPTEEPLDTQGKDPLDTQGSELKPESPLQAEETDPNSDTGERDMKRDEPTETSVLSQRTTEMTQDFMSVDLPVRVKRYRTVDSEKMKRLNEEWERKQQVIAERVKRNEELAETERQRLQQEAEEAKAQQLADRRKQLIAKKEAALAAREREQQLVREAQRRERTTPLHQRLERSFRAKSEEQQREYQRRLQEIHAAMAPDNSWRRHQQLYLSQRQARSLERRARELPKPEANPYFQAQIHKILEAEELAQAQLTAAKQAKRRELRLRQRQYACLVQEIHRPVSLPREPAPIALLSKLKSHDFRPKPSLRSPTVPAQSPKPRAVTKSVELQPKKRKNKSVRKSESEVLERSGGKRRDYLREQGSSGRAIRMRAGAVQYRPGLFLDLETKSIPKLRLEAERLSRKAAHKDDLLQQIPDLDSQIEASSSVTAMYLDSIRAKLRVINSFSEDEISY